MDGNRDARMNRLQLPDIVEGFGPDVARACETNFAARSRQRRRSKADGDGVTVGPKDDIARLSRRRERQVRQQMSPGRRNRFRSPHVRAAASMGSAAQIRSAVGVSSNLARIATPPARITIFRMPLQPIRRLARPGRHAAARKKSLIASRDLQGFRASRRKKMLWTAEYRHQTRKSEAPEHRNPTDVDLLNSRKAQLSSWTARGLAPLRPAEDRTPARR